LQLKGVQLSCVLVTVTSLMGGLLADSLKFQIDIKKNALGFSDARAESGDRVRGCL